MKNKTIPLILACMALSGLGYSEKPKNSEEPAKENSSPSLQPTRLMDGAFVVETSDYDVDQSLNRLAGNSRLDRGYASDENTYQSDNHSKAGPFARQNIYDSQS